MKRNWDIIRKILLRIEDLPDEHSQIDSDSLTGIDPTTAAYHLRLMRDASLIRGGCREAMGAPAFCYATAMTWQGHELLDAIRSESTWNRIKSSARDKGIDLTLSTLLALAQQVADSLIP